jgi:hypothetical protein
LQTTNGSERRRKTTHQIPSFKLSKDVLHDLVNIIEEESNAVRMNERCRVTYKFKVKQREDETKTDDSAYFLTQNVIRPDLKSIELRLYSDKKEISIYIYMNKPDSFIEIEGTDVTWVYGMASRIKAIFENPNSKRRVNDFFNSKKVLLVCILPSVLLGILHAIYLSNSLYGKVSSLICWPISYSIFLYLVFRWFFPRVETEYTRQAKIRKAILGGIGAIITTALVTLILRLLGI